MMNRRTTGAAAGLAALCMAASAAPGQARWDVEVAWTSSVEATVTVSAHFSQADYAFASGRFDLVFRGDGRLVWENLEVLLGAPGNPGLATPQGGVLGIEVGQIHDPPSLLADSRNPIPVWRADFIVWDRGDVACLATATEEFKVYPLALEPFAASRNAAEGAERLYGPGAPTHCYADCDRSGALDIFDFLCFQHWFVAGNLIADCNLDCFVDFQDFLCFMDEFAC